MNTGSYSTVKNPATAEFTTERSRFIGHCCNVVNEAEAKTFITAIRSEHAQATHNCYAYRLGPREPYLEYYNDHGEPGGTAGKPILGAIQRLNLTNVVVVVTRYFGGKKLGVRGLIEAYGKAASNVLAAAGTILKVPVFLVTLAYNYPEHATITHRLQQVAAEVLETNYTEIVTVKLAIPGANREDFTNLIEEFQMVNVVYGNTE
jgi:uncharacterized YigZ family protein